MICFCYWEKFSPTGSWTRVLWLRAEPQKTWPLVQMGARGTIFCFCSHELRECFRAWKWSSGFFLVSSFAFWLNMDIIIVRKLISKPGVELWILGWKPQILTVRLSGTVKADCGLQFYHLGGNWMVQKFWIFWLLCFYSWSKISQVGAEPGLCERVLKTVPHKPSGSLRNDFSFLIPWAQRILQNSKMEFRFFFLVRSFAFRLNMHFIIVWKKVPNRESDPGIVDESLKL